MAEIHQIDFDPDFQPLSRPRSCTWPLPRPDLPQPAGSATSSPAPPAPQEPGGGAELPRSLGLLEEDYEDEEQGQPGATFPCHLHHLQTVPPASLHHQQQVAPAGVPPPGASSQRKISSSRRNAWGNMSYADLITKAIESAPEKRLTLSQIYEWMVRSVPYFKDKGDSNSSAGWKNSIRHNLSLHSRFVRIQNEGTGKSSWWMLNPEGGKSGKSPRRRAASMDNNNKFIKSKGRAARKKMSIQEGANGGTASPISQYPSWMGSPNSHNNEDLEAWSSFRPRASSDASTMSGHCSPYPSEHDDLAEPDGHLMYHGATGPKISATLPSLSEVSGPRGQVGPERVMENLLGNLNLLSPKAHRLSSDSSNVSMLKNTSYGPPALPLDYHECLYDQAGMSSLSPAAMQTLPVGKPGFGAYENHYICPAGLFKELLTADGIRDTMPSRDAQGFEMGRGRCQMPSLNTQSHVGCHTSVIKSKTFPQSPPDLCSNPQALHYRGTDASRDLDCGNVIPPSSMTDLSGAPLQMTRAKMVMQLPHGHSAHSNPFFNDGYRDLTALYQRGHYSERLPSDLDSVSIERLECDLESVLNDTLMDGGALDFNLDSAAGSNGFPQRVKTTTHSWVSG